jgi:hypothetical protein
MEHANTQTITTSDTAAAARFAHIIAELTKAGAAHA